MENVQILTNYARISEWFIAGRCSESEVLEVWLAEVRKATYSSSPEGSTRGLGFSKVSVLLYTFRHSTKSLYNLSKNMIQCKIFFFFAL